MPSNNPSGIRPVFRGRYSAPSLESALHLRHVVSLDACFPVFDEAPQREFGAWKRQVVPGNVLFIDQGNFQALVRHAKVRRCLLYTSDAADERSSVDLGGRRIIKKK